MLLQDLNSYCWIKIYAIDAKRLNCEATYTNLIINGLISSTKCKIT